MPRARVEKEEEVEVKESKRVRKTNPFEDIKLEDCEPYSFNSSDLEEAEVKYKEMKDGDGNKVMSRTIWPGAPKFFLERNPRSGGDWYNLIGVYKNGKGTAQKSLRTFKPKDPRRIAGANKIVVERALEDNKWVKYLTEVRKLPIQTASPS